MKLSLAPLMIQVLISTLFIISHAISCNFLWGSERRSNSPGTIPDVWLPSGTRWSKNNVHFRHFVSFVSCFCIYFEATGHKVRAFLKEVPENLQRVLSWCRALHHGCPLVLVPCFPGLAYCPCCPSPVGLRSIIDRKQIHISAALISCVCCSLMASMWWVDLLIHQSEFGMWRQGTAFTH